MNPSLNLLAAVLHADAGTVTRWVSADVLADVHLTDAASATALTAAVGLAATGRDPEPVTVKDELMRRGDLAGHPGELVAARLTDAVTTVALPERIREYAAAVVAAGFRARLAAAGEAITAAADGSEADAWATVCTQGAALRIVWERLTTLRGAAA